MEVLNELLEEISCERKDKQSLYLENLIVEVFENGSYCASKIEKKYHCSISITTEKHNVLQVTHYITITSELINGELNLEIEDGINNGTQLNGYSFEGSIEPESRTVEVLKDVLLDEDMYKYSRFSVEKARAVFPRYKEKILKILSNRNYDDYVTGGGTNKTDKYYKSELDSIKDFGIFWKCTYEEVEADLNII